MTGIARSWIGSTIPLGSVVMIENSMFATLMASLSFSKTQWISGVRFCRSTVSAYPREMPT
jgi:hypothetical protein